MKRPEGFDSQLVPESKSKPKRRAAKAGKPRVVRNTPSVSPEPSVAREKGTSDRSSTAARAALRNRKRFEKSEIRRFTRRTRHRHLSWAIAVGLVAVLGGLLAVAVYSPLLSLRTITVEGAKSVDPTEVKDAIDGQLGTPLALFDYGKLRTELDGFPLIRSFATEIVPPSTLVVHIVERTPVGVLAGSSGFSVVDPAGVVLESSAVRKPGMTLIDVGGQGADSVAFSAVVDVLLALPDSIRSRVDIAGATSKDDVRLVLSGSGQRVVWGSSERSALKARVLQELIVAQGSKARVEYDVSAPLSPVVRPR